METRLRTAAGWTASPSESLVHPAKASSTATAAPAVLIARISPQERMQAARRRPVTKAIALFHPHRASSSSTVVSVATSDNVFFITSSAYDGGTPATASRGIVTR